MKVLITGGYGYIGSHLGRFLTQEKGDSVRLLGRHSTRPFVGKGGGFEHIRADVGRRDQLRGICEDCDAVIHLAALNRDAAAAAPGEALRASALGTRHLLEEARSAGVPRFLFFSTIHVYGIPGTGRVTEETPVDPLTDYSLAHHAGELYCRLYDRRHDLRAVVLRLANGYGAPLRRETPCWDIVVNEFCRMAAVDGRIVLKSSGTQARDFIAIPDILKAVDRLLRAPDSALRHEVYHVGSGVSRSIRDISTLVSRIAQAHYGREIPIEFNAFPQTADFSKRFRLDISRIRELGFEPGGDDILKREIVHMLRLWE